ncbi:hypothetical protein Fcan01_23785 [Folsomia candida]|uniref:Uncharacterized protein n=1 Tax=Folsomia candida TaxID=158441 RepID=A0A226D964_FOLCA|nr:hypothetical protein Fcan01_23785 [Folsomia candida]
MLLNKYFKTIPGRTSPLMRGTMILFVFILLTTRFCVISGPQEGQEGDFCATAEQCQDPPQKSGQPKLYKHCAVGSFLGFEYKSGFCLYSTDSKARVDFLCIGRGTCVRTTWRCKVDADCCRGLTCVSETNEHGYVSHLCGGNYDEEYANGLTYYKNNFRNRTSKPKYRFRYDVEETAIIVLHNYRGFFNIVAKPLASPQFSYHPINGVSLERSRQVDSENIYFVGSGTTPASLEGKERKSADPEFNTSVDWELIRKLEWEKLKNIRLALCLQGVVPDPTKYIFSESTCRDLSNDTPFMG